MTSSTDTMIGGPICHGVIPATLLDHEDRVLSAAARQSLWALFVEIGRFWGNLDEDSASVHSSWLEFVEAKTTRSPSYIGEYVNAVSVVQELVGLHGRDAFSLLFQKSGIPGGPPTTRLAHAKRYVVDEFIRMQVVAGGFKGFAQPASLNYNGYIGGSRYNRLPRARLYTPAKDAQEKEKGKR